MNPDHSLTIIAICLLILVIFAIVAAIYLIQLLIQLKKTTKSVEEKINPILEETKKITAIASAATERIKGHVESAKPLFQAFGKVCLIDVFSDRFKKNWQNDAEEINPETKQKKVDIGDWAEWIALGIVLVQKLRKK